MIAALRSAVALLDAGDRLRAAEVLRAAIDEHAVRVLGTTERRKHIIERALAHYRDGHADAALVWLSMLAPS